MDSKKQNFSCEVKRNTDFYTKHVHVSLKGKKNQNIWNKISVYTCNTCRPYELLR
jgi:hypothetical protein